MSDADLVKRLVEKYAQILKEAASEEHERLRAELEAFAGERGFDEKVMLPSGLRPDVLRRTGDKLFLGDAKVAENETCDRPETEEQIKSYIKTFAEFLRAATIKGGLIAIATNDKNAADAWAGALTKWCAAYGLLDGNKKAPKFRVTRRGKARPETWVVYW